LNVTFYNYKSVDLITFCIKRGSPSYKQCTTDNAFTTL